MAYDHKKTVEDGEIVKIEGNPAGVQKGPLIHTRDPANKARPVQSNIDGDIPVAPQGQVVAGDAVLGKKANVAHLEDAAGNAQTLKTNADGDVPVAPQGQVVAGDAAATKKGPLIHIEDSAGNVTTIKLNADGDITVAPQGQVATGDPVAGKKGPLIHIEDSAGNAKPFPLEADGSVRVSQTQLPPPPIGQQNVTRFITGALGSAGIARDGVTVEQSVDGSVTPVQFFIGSHLDYDIHVMQITLVIGDASVTHGKFGNVNPLANGWTLEIEESGEIYQIILNAKTGGELIAQSGFSNPFGNGASSFELTNWQGNSDASIITIPIYQWLPNGLRIGRTSTDELRSFVRDDLTGLLHFETRIFGFKNYPII